MYNFRYHKAETIENATSLIAQSDDPKILAGGHTLIPTLKQRLSQPSDIIDISSIDELKAITLGNGYITIGALCTHSQISNSPDIKKNLPGLAELANQIGDPQVRHKGTIGGSIANADPAADYPAAVLALEGEIMTSIENHLAANFFVDMFETALVSDEIITGIRLKIPNSSTYKKFRNPASGYAMVGVFMARYDNNVKIAVTGASSSAYRMEDLEGLLNINFNNDIMADIDIDTTNFNDDIHASAKYRGIILRVLLEEAILELR